MHRTLQVRGLKPPFYLLLGLVGARAVGGQRGGADKEAVKVVSVLDTHNNVDASAACIAVAYVLPTDSIRRYLRDRTTGPYHRPATHRRR